MFIVGGNKFIEALVKYITRVTSASYCGSKGLTPRYRASRTGYAVVDALSGQTVDKFREVTVSKGLAVPPQRETREFLRTDLRLFYVPRADRIPF